PPRTGPYIATTRTRTAGLTTAGGHGDHGPLGPRRRRRHGLRAHERRRAGRRIVAGGGSGGSPGLLPAEVRGPRDPGGAAGEATAQHRLVRLRRDGEYRQAAYLDQRGSGRR